MKKIFMLVLVVSVFTGFIFAGSITVNSPNGGESWTKGSVKTIMWNSAGLTNLVKITLWKNGVFVGLIIKDQPTNGVYNWTVGDYIGGKANYGSGYKIKVREQGGAQYQTQDESNNGFIITNPNPGTTIQLDDPNAKVNIIAPKQGESVTNGKRGRKVFYRLKWNALKYRGEIDLELINSDKKKVLGLIARGLNTNLINNSYNWEVGKTLSEKAPNANGYVIVVYKNNTRKILGKSKKFNIVSAISQLPEQSPSYDFTVDRTYFKDNRVVAQISNNKGLFKGDINIKYRRNNNKKKSIWLRGIELNQGVKKNITLFRLGENAQCFGEDIQVWINPDKDIKEINYQNNHSNRMIYSLRDQHDAKIISVEIRIGGRTYRVSNNNKRIVLPNNVGIRERAGFKVKVGNCGGIMARINMITVVQKIRKRLVRQRRMGSMVPLNNFITGYTPRRRSIVRFGHEENISFNSGTNRIILKSRPGRIISNKIEIYLDTNESGERDINNKFVFSIRVRQ